MATCTRCGVTGTAIRNCTRADCELVLARVDARQEPANDAADRGWVGVHGGVVSLCRIRSSAGNAADLSPDLRQSA